jgi:hypothetical protein
MADEGISSPDTDRYLEVGLATGIRKPERERIPQYWRVSQY